MRQASLVRLDLGEINFMFQDSLSTPRLANFVPLCVQDKSIIGYSVRMCIAVETSGNFKFM